MHILLDIPGCDLMLTVVIVISRVTSYVIRNTQYFTVLAKQLQYSGQKYVDLKLVRFQSVWYQNSIQHKQNV